jgi:hypothetical protein
MIHENIDMLRHQTAPSKSPQPFIEDAISLYASIVVGDGLSVFFLPLLAFFIN